MDYLRTRGILSFLTLSEICINPQTVLCLKYKILRALSCCSSKYWQST